MKIYNFKGIVLEDLGDNIFNLLYADLRGANLQNADLRGANLQNADLRGANLQDANLRGADLQGASLQDASLLDADLRGANLRGAKGFNKYLIQPLYILKDQSEKIRAYKFVTAEMKSPMQDADVITYAVGKTFNVKNANTNETVECAAGINVATLDWILKNKQTDNILLLVEFTAKDIAAIPINSDGKFRLHRCKVVKKLDWKDYT